MSNLNVMSKSLATLKPIDQLREALLECLQHVYTLNMAQQIF